MKSIIILVLFTITACNIDPKKVFKQESGKTAPVAEKPAEPVKFEKEWFLLDFRKRATAEYDYLFEDMSIDKARSDSFALSVMPDGRFSMFNEFGHTFGKWEPMANDPDIIHFTPAAGNLEKKPFYLVKLFMNGERLVAAQFANAPFDSGRQVYNYVFEGRSNRSGANPYDPKWHSWRKRPANPETDAEIKKRVLNYLNFLKIWYKYNIDNNIDRPEAFWYPEPLRLNNDIGVRMAYSDETEDWNKCFYDAEQAVKGYQVISAHVGAMELKKAPTKAIRNHVFVTELIGRIQ